MVTLNTDDMTPVINRLRRAQGQIGGVIRLIEEGRDCQDIVHEAASSGDVSPDFERALDDGARNLLDGAGNGGGSQGQMISGIVATLIGPALSAAFNRSLDATAPQALDRPTLLGGGRQAVSGRYHLACNLKPTTPVEVALDAWNRFCPW